MPTHPQNDFIFSLYKPFRNQLRDYELLDSLELIWNFSRNLTFDLPFSRDIELTNKFKASKNLTERRINGIPEFEQEYLLKEILINCETYKKSKTLKRVDNLAKLINYLRFDFRDGMSKRFSKPEDILLEFNRLAHQQFSWQIAYNQNIIFRYYKIYNSGELSKLVKNVYGLTTFELFFIGFFLFRWTAEHFRIIMPINFPVSFITNEMVQRFIELFSISIDKAKTDLIECREMNEYMFHSYNPLLAKPLLIYENTFICPIHLLLFWQITGGIYYSIINQQGFENAFGNSFQDYVGEVLNSCCPTSKFQIFSEETYGKEEKKSADWILLDNDSILFIECKTKRMTLVSKTHIDLKDGLQKDLEKMAGFITQVYKTYIDYKENNYPQIKFDGTKKFIPVVLTLETWYITINLKLMEILKELVFKNFFEEGLDPTLLETNPYHLWSSEDFEREIQMINEIGIKKYFDLLSKNQLAGFAQNFKVKNIFEGQFEKTFLDPMK